MAWSYKWLTSFFKRDTNVYDIAENTTLCKCGTDLDISRKLGMDVNIAIN